MRGTLTCGCVVYGGGRVDACALHADPSPVEVEELRGALRALIYSAETTPDVDRQLLGCPTDAAVIAAVDLLARPPTIAALRAREALAALAWAEAQRANGLADFTSREHEAWVAAERARDAYLDAREAREKAEETKP